MEEKSGYEKYINKKVILSVDAGAQKPYSYRGYILAVNTDAIYIEDEKEGNIDIPKIRLIAIKEVRW